MKGQDPRMVCCKCKTRNNYYHFFCYSCGAKLDNQIVALPGRTDPSVTGSVLLNKQREMFNPYRERKLSNRMTRFAAILSATAIICMVLFFISRG